MIVYPAQDIPPFVMYCVNGKPRSSLLIESTDSMIPVTTVLKVNMNRVDNINWSLAMELFFIPFFYHGVESVDYLRILNW